MMTETDDRFYVAESTIAGAGMGLFARVPLATGAELRVIGVAVDPGSLSDLCTRYADPYKLRAGGKLIIPLGFGGMINHAAQPNLERLLRDDTLFLRAVRPIDAGEELFIRYSDYAIERFFPPPAR